MDAHWSGRRLIILRITYRLHDSLEDQLIRTAFLGFIFVRLQGREEGVDALEKAFVNDAFVLVGLDFVLAFGSLLVDLILLCANKGTFVHVGVDFDVRVVAELESILKEGGVVSLENVWRGRVNRISRNYNLIQVLLLTHLL